MKSQKKNSADTTTLKLSNAGISDNCLSEFSPDSALGHRKSQMP
ncbi:hypothetical protein [Methanosarcina lacustris]|nr:hypothetical protein [Methanosarcina lacustris]